MPDRYLLRIGFLLAGVLALGLLGASFLCDGWCQDVLLNAAFMILGALFTAAIIDRLVKRHEEALWAKPRAIALIRLRRSATGFVNTVSLSTSGETIERAETFQPPGWHRRVDPKDYNRYLYTNPAWLTFIRSSVIPATLQVSNTRDPDALDRLIGSLHWYEEHIWEDLALFSAYLSPTQVEHLTDMLDRIPLERWALQARRNLSENQTPPDLTEIVERSLELIEESNRNPDTQLPPAWEEATASTPAHANRD